MVIEIYCSLNMGPKYHFPVVPDARFHLCYILRYLYVGGNEELSQPVHPFPVHKTNESDAQIFRQAGISRFLYSESLARLANGCGLHFNGHFFLSEDA